MQVLHCVVYPRLAYGLPIFSLDLVERGGRATLAICDTCPSTLDLRLPPPLLLASRYSPRPFLCVFFSLQENLTKK